MISFKQVSNFMENKRRRIHETFKIHKARRRLSALFIMNVTLDEHHFQFLFSRNSILPILISITNSISYFLLHFRDIRDLGIILTTEK